MTIYLLKACDTSWRKDHVRRRVTNLGHIVNRVAVVWWEVCKVVVHPLASVLPRTMTFISLWSHTGKVIS
jgi:hypothetical protein